MKIISLKVSKMFPCTHPRKGELTNFREKIFSGEKIHTVRSNYEAWKKRVDQVNSGSHFCRVEQWSGVPYKSKLDPSFWRFPERGPMGIQKLDFVNGFMTVYVDGKHQSVSCIAGNGGLSTGDFIDWFKPYDLTEPMAIIHFTDCRY